MGAIRRDRAGRAYVGCSADTDGARIKAISPVPRMPAPLMADDSVPLLYLPDGRLYSRSAPPSTALEPLVRQQPFGVGPRGTWQAPASVAVGLPAGATGRLFQLPSAGHLDEVIERVIAHARDVRGVKASTIAWVSTAYRLLRASLAELHLEPAFLSGDLPRQQAVLAAWITWMRHRGNLHSTINGHWRAARLLLKWAAEQTGMLNPFLWHPTPKASRAQSRWLAKRDAEGALHWVRHAPWKTRLELTRNMAIVGVMLYAGLRRGEVVALRYGDVDVEARVIHIVRGKGPNGGKSRPARIPTQLATILTAYKRERERAGRTHPEFFTSVRRARGIGPTAVRRLVCKVSAGTGHAITPHVLRHTQLTILHNAGVPTRTLQDLGGHSSLQMTERYTHVASDELQVAAEHLVLDVEDDLDLREADAPRPVPEVRVEDARVAHRRRDVAVAREVADDLDRDAGAQGVGNE